MLVDITNKQKTCLLPVCLMQEKININQTFLKHHGFPKALFV